MRIKSIVKRILLQRRGDKRSLALLFLAPLIILTLLYFLLQVPSDVKFRLGLDNQTSQATSTSMIASQLEKSDKFDVIKVTDNSRQTVNDKSLDAVLVVKDNKLDVTYTNRDTGKTQQMFALLSRYVQAGQEQKLTNVPTNRMAPLSPPTIEQHYLYGDSSTNLFKNLAPILVVFFVFFFVFLISGISLVNERTSGTLGRMLITPIKRYEIVTGYSLSYGLLAVVQTILVLLWTHFVLGMQILGSFAWVIVINLLIALIALLLGLLLSALAKTEFQFVQLIPIAIVPQFFFSGLINVDTMPAPMQWLAHLMPLYYGVDGLQRVIKQAQGFSAISFDLLILILIAGLLYMLNVLALKNLRRT